MTIAVVYRNPETLQELKEGKEMPNCLPWMSGHLSGHSLTLRLFWLLLTSFIPVFLEKLGAVIPVVSPSVH